MIQTFTNKTVLQRAAVIIAGPLMNILLAMALFALIFSIMGVPYIGTSRSRLWKIVLPLEQA